MLEIAFDIETIANADIVDHLPEPVVLTGNLKDPAKIEEKIRAAKQEQIDRMALSPLYGRVCAFVATVNDGSFAVERGCIAANSDEEEISLLCHIFSTIAGRKVVTYNGANFDLPFIYRRAVLLGMDIREFGLPPLSEYLKRYENKLHTDVMTAWSNFGNFEKLDNLSKAFGFSGKIEIDFADFPELIRTEIGRKTILDYCQQDVALTLSIYNRISGILI